MSFCFFTIESAIPSNLYFKSMCTAPEFCKGTFISSIVHKYNIIFQFMILLILSVKAQINVKCKEQDSQIIIMKKVSETLL